MSAGTETGRDDFNLQEAFELAREAMRTLLAINGGAAIAVLAFYGQSSASAARASPASREAVGAALSWFAWGAGLAATTALLGYVTQSLWGRSYPSEHSRAIWVRRANYPHLIALLTGIASFIFFAFGVSDMKKAIQASAEPPTLPYEISAV